MSNYSFTVVKEDGKLTIKEPEGNIMWFIPDGKYLVSGHESHNGHRSIILLREDLDGENILSAHSMMWRK